MFTLSHTWCLCCTQSGYEPEELGATFHPSAMRLIFASVDARLTWTFGNVWVKNVCLVPRLYLHNKEWVVLSCPEALEEWWSSIHEEGCALSGSRRFSNGEHKPVRGEQERKTNSDTGSFCKKQTRQSADGHPPTSDCLNPFLARLESVRLCGCQMIITEKGN